MSRAYLIDPFSKTVSEVIHRGLPDIYAFVDTDRIDAAHIGSMTKNDGRLVRVVIYVNDDGYFVREQMWFRFGAYPNPLAGRGLLVGIDHEGDDIDPPLDIDNVRQMVTWLGAETPDLPDVVHYTVGADGMREVGRWDQNLERDHRLKKKDGGNGTEGPE